MFVVDRCRQTVHTAKHRDRSMETPLFSLSHIPGNSVLVQPAFAVSLLGELTLFLLSWIPSAVAVVAAGRSQLSWIHLCCCCLYRTARWDSSQLSYYARHRSSTRDSPCIGPDLYWGVFGVYAVVLLAWTENK